MTTDIRALGIDVGSTTVKSVDVDERYQIHSAAVRILQVFKLDLRWSYGCALEFRAHRLDSVDR